MPTQVYLNGKYMGEVDNSSEFIKNLKQERSKDEMLNNMNFFLDTKLNVIHIESSRGRCRRPLIVVKDGTPLLTDKHIKQLQKNEISWNDLVKQGVIEYLDAAEEENTLIAFTEQELTHEHTHLEISPLVMLGPIFFLVALKNSLNSLSLFLLISLSPDFCIPFFA